MLVGTNTELGEFLFALTELRAKNSVSSSQPIYGPTIFVCAKANSLSFSQNSPTVSLPEDSVSSLLRKIKWQQDRFWGL